MTELTLEGVLTVEKFLMCSSYIKYVERKYDLNNLPNYHLNTLAKCHVYNTSMCHKFIGDYITDIKITNISNVDSIILYDQFNKLNIPYKVINDTLEILDFQGIRAVGSGIWLKYQAINEAEPITGTLLYRSLYPLTYMGDIETDILFCQLLDGRFLACQDGKIYTDYLERKIQYLKVYANHNYESTHLMYKWPVYEYNVRTLEPDRLRVPWITILSCENGQLVISIKSENAGRFEQLAVATCSKWEKLFSKGEVDKQLSDFVNQKINDFYKAKVLLYNKDKETLPVLICNDNRIIQLEAQYTAEKKYLQSLKEMCKQQNPTLIKYYNETLNKTCDCAF